MATYTIRFYDDAWGIADVEKEGLYYHITCRSNHQKGMYQVLVTGDQGNVNLGTCIPYNEGIGLTTRVAAKRLGTIKEFSIIEKQKEESNWIPLISGKPVHSLSILSQSHLLQNGDRNGLKIT